MTSARLPKILLVDDDPRVLRSLKVNLKHDFEVYLANDGESAIKIFEQQESIVAVLTDERMPKLSGHELLIWLKRNHPLVLRILITGYSNEDVLHILDNEVKEYYHFEKPWDVTKIKKAILNSVESKKIKTIQKTNNQKIPVNSTVPPRLSVAVLEINNEPNEVYQQIREYLQLEVKTFNNISQCLTSLVKNNNTPVLLVDAEIGNKNFINLVKAVNEINSNINIVAMITTHNSGEEYIKMVSEKKIFQYITKPFSINRILPMMMKSIHQFKFKHSKNKNRLGRLSQIWDKSQ